MKLKQVALAAVVATSVAAIANSARAADVEV